MTVVLLWRLEGAFGRRNRREKAASAVDLLRHRTSTRWVLLVLENILFLSMYSPHSWGGEADLEEYKTPNVVNMNMQDIKQKFYISGIVAGMVAQVEAKPHQELFVGGGMRLYRWEPTRAKTNRLDFWKMSEADLQKWKIIDYFRGPNQLGNKEHSGKKLLGS